MPALVPLLPLLATLLLAAEGRSQAFLSQEQALKLAFPQADRIEKTIVTLTTEQREIVSRQTGLKKPVRIYKRWVGWHGEEFLGYAVLDAVRGKARDIDFMVATDPSLVVRSVEILAYRETHGGEVRGKSWREQFVGKTHSSSLRVGRDIRNIAGATISCRAVTDGVRRNLSYLSVLAPPTIHPPREISAKHEPPLEPSIPTRRNRVSMGTTLEITAFSSSEEHALLAIDAAYREVDRIESILSSWQPNSELSRLNLDAGDAATVRDATLVDFVKTCLTWSRKTNGAIDATVGPLIDLWKRAETRGSMPSESDVNRTRALTGSHLITLDPSTNTLGLTKRDARLDAGAIGKGYALDRAATVLRELGISSALLNFGGQVLALGPQPDQTPWPIRLRPIGDQPELLLEISTGSLATSSDGERALTIGSTRFSHIVDPSTGYPAAGGGAVTVFSSTATEADALSTAMFVMGPEAAAKYAHEHRSACLIRGNGHSTMTTAFEATLKKQTVRR